MSKHHLFKYIIWLTFIYQSDLTTKPKTTIAVTATTVTVTVTASTTTTTTPTNSNLISILHKLNNNIRNRRTVNTDNSVVQEINNSEDGMFTNNISYCFFFSCLINFFFSKKFLQKNFNNLFYWQ